MRCNILSNNYEAKTKDELLEKILNEMPAEYLKTPGTFTHDLSNALAIVMQPYENEIEKAWKYFDISFLTGEELEKRVYQLKGITRKQSTYAIGELTLTGNGTVNVGDLFETPNAVQFMSLESKRIADTGKIKIQAVQAGIVGNVGAKSIVLMPMTIQGIKACINEQATYDGFEAEDDASLLDRYYIAVRTPATSGNKYHYMQWSREITGVGNSKVFPLWNGDNTVKVVIIDSNKQPASEDLVKKVQDYIDPKGENEEQWGAGYGMAPIGAYCTVQTATEKEIRVNAKIVLETGEDIEAVTEEIKKNITAFLQEIAFKKDYVSYSLIASTLLDTPGVAEWTELTLNNGTTNVTIGVEEVAVLKEVNVYEQK